MPTIKVPANITLTNPDGATAKDQNGNEIQVDFVKSFLVNTVTNDPKFGKNVGYLYAAMDLASAFNGKNPGDTVFLSSELWAKLKEVINEPSSPYNTAIMKQCRSFFQAILEPTDNN